jgi:hypothetical protein
MKKTNLILLLLSVVLTFSCKKIEPPMDPSEANDPIYLLEGIMNGDSLSLFVNDTTIFISQAPYNMNGVEAYSSTISNLETGFELKMIVLRPELFLSETGVQSINETNTNFLVHQSICKSFDFSNGSNQGDYTKIIANGTSYNGSQIELNEYGIYDIDFNFNNINSQIYTIPVEVGFRDESLNPYFEISLLNNNILFESENSDVTNIWFLDGNQISTNLMDSTEVTNGIHSITHQVTDAYNNTASYTTLINYYENLIWQMSPSYCFTDVIENNYGSVIIEVIHQGETYTSVYNTANLTKEFTITNVEYFIDATSQSIEFVKLNVNFDTELKTINNSKTLNLTNMKGTFHIKIN